MDNNKLTQEMKRHAIIVAILATKVRRELEASIGKVLASAENINLVQTQLEHCSLSSKSRTLLLKTLFIKAISRDLQVSECTIRYIVHEDIRCTNLRTAIHPEKKTFKQGKTSGNPGYVLVLF